MRKELHLETNHELVQNTGSLHGLAVTGDVADDAGKINLPERDAGARLEYGRYQLTAVSQRLHDTKLVLSGKDYRSGKRVEIPPADIENKAFATTLIYHQEEGKYYRNDASALSDKWEMPTTEGGLFRNPPKILEALIVAGLNPAEFPLNQYPSYDVKPEYLVKIADFFKQAMGIQWVTADCVAVGYGSNDLINGALSIVLNTSSSQHREYVLMQVNEYHSYARIAEKWYGEVIFIEKLSKDSLNRWWNCNPEQREKLKAILFTNPVASTGEIYAQEELLEIANFVQEKNLFVIVDQIYATSVFNPSLTTFASIAAIKGMETRTLTVWSPSKDLGCIGVRQGFICASAAIIQQMYLYAQYSTVTPGIMNQSMGLKALDLIGSEYHRSVAVELMERAKLIITKINEINQQLNKFLVLHNPVLYALLSQASDQAIEFISLPVVPRAGHSIILKFHHLDELGMVDRYGNVIQNNLDLTAFIMDYGVALSPLYPSGNNNMEVRFAFSQFGEQASVGPYLVELRAGLAQQGIMLGQGYKFPVLNPKYAAVKTFDEAQLIGRNLIVECLTKIQNALCDIYSHQDSWLKRHVYNSYLA